MENEITISCIIPAYNEAGRIGALLDVVVGHKLVSQVIVVDDGSTDGTGAAAARPGVELICLSPNGGKTAAVRAGTALASGSHIMLLDADRWWLGNGLRLSVVRWPDVASPAKSAKFGLVEGMKRDIAMLRDMFRIITFREACSQIFRMRSRSVASHSDLPRELPARPSVMEN